MAALVTPYSVGNQAAMIRSAFTPRSMAGLGWLGNTNPSLLSVAGDIQAPVINPGQYNQQGSGIFQTIADAVGGFVQSRWGQQRGTITMLPDGTIVQKQAAGMPIDTLAPSQYGGQYNVQAPEGFATGIATGTLMAVGIGAVVLIVLMTKKR